MTFQLEHTLYKYWRKFLILAEIPLSEIFMRTKIFFKIFSKICLFLHVTCVMCSFWPPLKCYPHLVNQLVHLHDLVPFYYLILQCVWPVINWYFWISWFLHPKDHIWSACHWVPYSNDTYYFHIRTVRI